MPMTVAWNGKTVSRLLLSTDCGAKWRGLKRLLDRNFIIVNRGMHEILITEGFAMLVQQILSSKGDHKVVTVKPGTLVSDAAQTLAERRIGVLIVSQDGAKVDGIISERDIVRSLGVCGAKCLTETVEEMMTSNPVCCTQ